MTILHFIPDSELELHAPSVNCLCDPEFITSDRLTGTRFEGAMAYQHDHFSPLEPETDRNGMIDFTVYPERAVES